MNLQSLTRAAEFEWRIEPTGKMRVPAVVYAGEELVRNMDEKVREQLTNVATLPGIQRAAFAMPDAHWGYGFPIGGVAAFDPEEGGVISAGAWVSPFPVEYARCVQGSLRTNWSPTKPILPMLFLERYQLESAAQGRSSSATKRWLGCYPVARDGR